jgi:hypothetical protein
MTRPSLRFACAAFGLLLLALAAFHVRVLPIVLGVLMLVPAAFGESDDEIEGACLRFRNAAFGCFGVAIALLTFVLSLTDRRGPLAQQAASLGAACWLVAMLMTFCFAFYASKRRALN